MDTVTCVQNLKEAVCASRSSYIFRKGMNPIIPPPVMGKIVGHTGLFNLGMATGLWEEKL